MALTVEPDPLTAGGQATITITGSSHAGEIVQVTITNDDGNESKPDITLDMDGKGSTTWQVPNWTEAHFNYSSCAQVSRTITNDSTIPTTPGA